MNKSLQNYFHSFKLKKNFLQTFLADLISFSIILGFFFWLTSTLQAKMLAISGGKSAEQIQQMITTATPEELLPFMTGLKSILVIGILGIIFFVTLSLLLNSLTNAYIWNTLTEKKLTKKNYWRWNLMNLGLIIPVTIFGIFFLVLKLVLTYLFNKLLTISPNFYFAHPQLMETIQLFFQNSLNQFFFVAFLLMLFLIYYSFVKEYKVFFSIGDSFKILKTHWNKLWRWFMAVFVTSLIVGIMVNLLVRLLSYQQNLIFVFTAIILLLFISWARIYLIRNLHLDHPFNPDSQKTL